MASSIEEEPLQERLKAALWYAVGKIVDEESLKNNVNATPQFIGALTELVWSQAEYLAQDLETFAQHAGRRRITTDDVLLVARRTEALHGMLKDEIDRVKAKSGGEGQRAARTR